MLAEDTENRESPKPHGGIHIQWGRYHLNVGQILPVFTLSRKLLINL